MISYEDFKKVEIKVGKILSAEKIPDTDKLLKLMVDFGQKNSLVAEKGDSVGLSQDNIVENVPVKDVRQIVSGIALYFSDPQILLGKKCMFVTNLEPRSIRGFESNGMVLAVSTEDGRFSLLEPNNEIPEGTTAK